MPRNYRHIQPYEKELLKLKEEGLTVKAIGEKNGYTCMGFTVSREN